MFGNVSSSWANPQQNQQQQQQQAPSAFGQPSAFGATNTTNTFGSTGAFGQPQQPQQQQQANPMFGGLATPATNTASTGFGGFGGTATNATGVFGAKPTTGFGAFGGGGSTFGGAGAGTSTFGQPAAGTTTTPASTGLFGQPAAATGTTSTFGGTGLFGNKPSVFGAAASTTGTPPVVTTGTSNPPFAAHSNKEEGGTFQYQSISCIPAYAGYSFEELRVQDYTQGRKTANAVGGAFGQPTAFSAAQPAATTGLFGVAQPAQNTTSAFGAATPAAPTTGFGAFGSSQPAQTTTQPAGGLFGGAAFGANATAQPTQTNAFGGFGQPQQQQPQHSTGIFGGGPFGSTAAKPNAFGTFGSTTTTAAPATTTFGGTAFGTAQPQQTATTGGLFGNTQQTTAQPATNAFGGGAFGTNAAKPLFGSTTTQPTTTGFGPFGTNTQQQQPAQTQQTTGGLFGGGGLFGNTQQQPQQQAAPTTGLFGNTGTQAQTTGTGFGGGGGLFGNTQTQQNQQQQPSTGLFGAPKPATTTTGTGGLFGGGAFGQPYNATTTQQTGGGVFGNSALGQPGNQQQLAFGGGLFNKPAPTPLGTSMSTGGTGLFGPTFGNSANNLNASAAAPGVQGTLTASIAQPIGSNLPIFSMLPPGPRLVDLDQSQPKKKPPFFVDIPTRSPIPRVFQSFAPASSKLRGFGSSVAGQSSVHGNPFAGNNGTVSFLSGKPNALAISDGRASSVGPDSFLGRSGSPALGSGSRQSVKKVILDKKVEPAHLFVKSGSPGIPGSKIVFSPALSIAARESEAAAAANAAAKLNSPSPAPRTQQRSPNRFTANSTKNIVGGTSDPSELEEGDYYVKPDLASLKRLGYDQLSSFKGLVVGRVGYGEIEFLEPVDLTGLPKLSALLGDVVHFDPKECSVYPDSEEGDKPPPGSGLNVKAKLTLERCWALDKATREPIKDANHPTVVKHLKRLKNMKDTHFESFDMDSGKWTFTVDHF